MDEKISIVVPIYKVPIKNLKNNIEHLINQSYKNIEIVLVDDGSPDECGNICDFYAKKDSRIKVIHQKNKGLSGARNSGVKKSNGEWILFVDGDDYLEENTCTILSKYLSDDIDIVCFSSNRVINGKKNRQLNQGMENNKLYQNTEINELKKNTLNFNSRISSACGKAINKRFINKFEIYHNEDLKQGAEGIEFVFRLFSHANQVFFINEYLYNYEYNENSISSKPTEENNKLIIKCFNEILKNIDINDKDLLDMFYNRLAYVCVTTAISGYFNPKQNYRWNERVKKMSEFCENRIINECLNRKHQNLDLKRNIIMFLIKNKMHCILFLLAKIKNYKKE